MCTHRGSRDRPVRTASRSSSNPPSRARPCQSCCRRTSSACVRLRWPGWCSAVYRPEPFLTHCTSPGTPSRTTSRRSLTKSACAVAAILLASYLTSGVRSTLSDRTNNQAQVPPAGLGSAMGPLGARAVGHQVVGVTRYTRHAAVNPEPDPSDAAAYGRHPRLLCRPGSWLKWGSTRTRHKLVRGFSVPADSIARRACATAAACPRTAPAATAESVAAAPSRVRTARSAAVNRSVSPGIWVR
jgi:hypothetical protein